MAIRTMIDYSVHNGVDVAYRIFGNALVHQARNKAIAKRRPDCDYVLMVDDDMVPQPESLVQLLAHKLPVVSALCTNRSEPVVYVVKVLDEKTDQFCPITDFRMNRLLRGKYAPGTAFVLIHRSVLEGVIEYYLSGRDWLNENRRFLDRLCVRSENREKERAHISELRRVWFEKDGYTRLFDFPVVENQQQLGEDIAFFRKVLKAGFETAVDTGCWIGHMGDYAFGPWDIQPRKDPLTPILDAEDLYAHV